MPFKFQYSSSPSVDADFVADLDIIRNGEHHEISNMPTLMNRYLLEARRLLTEKKGACCEWRFPYDFGNPPFAKVRAYMPRKKNSFSF